MTTFSIKRGYSCREATAIRVSADRLGAVCVTEDRASPGSVPIGPVEYCEPLFPPHQKIFYPPFLSELMLRSWGTMKGEATMVDASFVKDATCWKSGWASGVYPAGTYVPPGKWLLSEPVVFTNEWRYYVADGSVVTTGWYLGEDENLPAPALDVSWPDGFSGAVDFGTLPDGRLALVECHAPFACGWYGDKHDDYALWQAIAWEHSGWWHKSLDQ